MMKDYEKVQTLYKSFKKDQNSASWKKKIDNYLKNSDFSENENENVRIICTVAVQKTDTIYIYLSTDRKEVS